MSSPDEIRPAPWAPDASVAAGLSDWGPPRLGGRGPQPAGQRGIEPAAEPDPVGLAHERGFEEGLAEGARRAEVELGPVKRMLADLALAMEQEQVVARRTADQNITAMAVAVSRWLFQRKVAADPELLRELVTRGVQLLPAPTSVEVRGNPIDLEAMGGHLALTEADGRPVPLHWIPDPTLPRGSFTLASPERIIDGRADVALRSLYERLASE